MRKVAPFLFCPLILGFSRSKPLNLVLSGKI